MENKAHETGTKQLEEQNHNLIVVRAKPVNDAYKSTKTSTESVRITYCLRMLHPTIEQIRQNYQIFKLYCYGS